MDVLSPVHPAPHCSCTWNLTFPAPQPSGILPLPGRSQALSCSKTFVVWSLRLELSHSGPCRAGILILSYSSQVTLLEIWAMATLTTAAQSYTHNLIFFWRLITILIRCLLFIIYIWLSFPEYELEESVGMFCSLGFLELSALQMVWAWLVFKPPIRIFPGFPPQLSSPPVTVCLYFCPGCVLLHYFPFCLCS